MNRPFTNLCKASFALLIAVLTTTSVSAQDWSNITSQFEFPEEGTELPELRDQHSKHFLMPNGNIQAFILSGSLHYMDEQGKWQDISTEITPSSSSNYTYENTANGLKSYFPDANNARNEGITLRNQSGSIRIAIQPSINGLDANFEENSALYDTSPTPISVTANEIVYEDLVSGIHNMFEVQHDLIKNNVIVEALPGNVAGSEFIGYSETLELPAGWKLMANNGIVEETMVANGGLIIVNEQNAMEFVIPVPDVYEQNNPSANIHPDGDWDFTYKIEPESNNTYRLTTLVPMDWMTDPSRQYPVVIDPTVTLNGNWGGWLRPTSIVESNPSIFVYCGFSGDPYSAWTKFDISSVPNSGLVIDTKLQAYMNATLNGSASETIELNSVTGTMGPYTTYNASAYTDISNGTYTSFSALDVGTYGYYDLGPTADADVQSNLNLGEFQVGFYNGNLSNPPYKRFTSNLNVLEVEYVTCSGQVNATANPVMLSNGLNLGCPGDSNASVSTSASGGSGTYFFIWSGPGYNDTVNNPTNLHAGTYFLQVFDDGLTCPDTMTIVISEPDLTVNTTLSQFGSYNLACAGNADGTISASVAGTGPYSYSWTGPGGFTSSNASLSALAPGTYYYTVTETVFGCVVEDSVTLTSPPLVTTTAQLDSNAFCENESNGGVSAMPSGGVGNFTYQWDDPNSTTTASATGLAVGTYNVTVTDGNGCTAVTSVDVGFEIPLPLIDLGPDTGICTGGSVILNTGGGFLSYAWSDGSTGQFIEVDAFGVYEVTVTDFEGCMNSDAVEVNQEYPLPTPNLGPNISTPITPVVLDPGSYESYLWSTGSFDPTISVGLSGTYSVVVTDENGCEGSDEIVVSIWAAGISSLDASGINIYPNPAIDRLTIDATASAETALDITLTNAVGQVVYHQTAATSNRIFIEVGSMDRGTYFLTAVGKETVWNRSIVLE